MGRLAIDGDRGHDRCIDYATVTNAIGTPLQ
jgi:hypothetical protein